MPPSFLDGVLHLASNKALSIYYPPITNATPSQQLGLPYCPNLNLMEYPPTHPHVSSVSYTHPLGVFIQYMVLRSIHLLMTKFASLVSICPLESRLFIQ